MIEFLPLGGAGEIGANCYYLAQGVDPDVFKPTPVNEKYRKDKERTGKYNNLYLKMT